MAHFQPDGNLHDYCRPRRLTSHGDNLMAYHHALDAVSCDAAGLKDLEGLLERLRRGDEAALEALMDQYWSRLVRYAETIVEGEDAAEDMVQETFVRIWQARRSIIEPRALPSLLYTTTRNLSLNEKRRRRVRLRLSFRSLLPRPSAASSPLAGAEMSELDAAAARAIEALPTRRREIFKLARHHGLSHREIAEVLGISTQTVANQMTAASKQIRHRLQTYLSD